MKRDTVTGWLLLAAALAMIALLAIWLVYDQTRRNDASFRAATADELAGVAAPVGEDLQRGAYVAAADVVEQWARRKPDVLSIEVTAANGYRIAAFERAGDRGTSMTAATTVPYSYRSQARITLVKDLRPLDAARNRLVAEVAGVYLLVAVFAVLLMRTLLLYRQEAKRLRDQIEHNRVLEAERAKVERHNSQLASLVQHSQEFIGIFQLDGRADFINDFGRQLLGIGPDDDGQGRTIRDFVRPSEHARLAAEIMPALTAAGQWSGELGLRRRDDTAAVPTLTQAFRIDDLAGQPLCFATVSRDMTAFKQADAELRQLEDAFLSETDRQQSRLGRELHDGLGQELTGLSLLVSALARQADRQQTVSADALAAVAAVARRAIGTARDIARGLSPLAENEGQLVSSLRQLVERAGAAPLPAVSFHVAEAGSIGIDAEAQNHLYRIVQEALSNALRHAGATEIDVRVEIDASRIRVTVADNGVGIPAGSAAEGLGLRTMRYRALAIGGSLAIRRGAMGGCIVACQLDQAGAGESIKRAQ